MPEFDWFSDTHPKALELFIQRQREMSPGDKLAEMFRMNAMFRRMAEAGVRLLYPAAGDREVFLRVAARHLGRETMIRAYGWDPAEHP